MVFRGKHKISVLHQQVMPEQQATLFPEQQKTLYEKKVAAITARYFYYITNKVDGKSLLQDEILIRLSQEFFLSTGRITDILVDNATEITKLRTQAPKPSWFKTNWAHLVW